MIIQQRIDKLAIQLLYLIMGSQLSSTHWNELGPSMVVELVKIRKWIGHKNEMVKKLDNNLWFLLAI